jgi:hypothetical protein
MSSFDDTYEYMLDIIETLESKINYLESHLLNSLQSKLKINNNYIELLETKLESEFSKNEKLNATIISLETKLKDQIDELFSITYNQTKVCIADPKITNKIVELFDNKLDIEFAKNDKLKKEIILLENKLNDKKDYLYSFNCINEENLKSYSKTVITAFNIALGI